MAGAMEKWIAEAKMRASDMARVLSASVEAAPGSLSLPQKEKFWGEVQQIKDQAIEQNIKFWQELLRKLRVFFV